MPEVGDRANVHLDVTAADTALAAKSGDVRVLATPRVVALCEEAAVAAIADSLDDGVTTVGTHINLSHSAPTPVGASVEAIAEVATIEGRMITFSVGVYHNGRSVAQGTHTRALVDRQRFLTSLE